MFGPIGITEMIIILTIALVVFGPRKLPELGRSLGRSLNEFKRASNELRSTLEDEIRLEEHKEERKKVQAEQASAVAAAQPAPSSPADSAPADSAAAAEESPDEPAHTVSRGTPA